jgi:hypothetical protein
MLKGDGACRNWDQVDSQRGLGHELSTIQLSTVCAFCRSKTRGAFLNRSFGGIVTVLSHLPGRSESIMG